MITKKYFLLLTFFFFSFYSSQTNEPIVFGDFGLGPSKDFSSDKSALNFNFSLNYEVNKNLFTARYVSNTVFKAELISLIIPIISTEIQNNDWGILYGRRFTKKNTAYSFSGGISSNSYIIYSRDANGGEVKNKENSIGFPFEVNIKWFKSERKPYRIMGLIPVGQPTSLGNSIGFKLLGNISKHSYFGGALVFGFGNHKDYGAN